MLGRKNRFIVIGFVNIELNIYGEQLDCCKIDKHSEEQLHCCKIDKNNEEQLDCCRICKYKYLQPIIFQNSRDSFAGGSVSLDVRTSSKHLSLLVAAC